MALGDTLNEETIKKINDFNSMLRFREEINKLPLFVKIEGGIEGLVHISEASRRKVENLEEEFKVGDRVNVVVLGVDIGKKKL